MDIVKGNGKRPWFGQFISHSRSLHDEYLSLAKETYMLFKQKGSAESFCVTYCSKF